MTLHKQKENELLFLLLYARSFGANEEKALIESLSDELKVAKSHVVQALKKCELIEKEIAFIEDKIKNTVKAYEYERVQNVEKTVLHLGAYELFFDKKALPLVVKEAIRLTKKFSTEAATSFVHAILDALAKEVP